MAKKMTAAEREVIQVAAAKAIQGNLVTKYGVGYRVADLVNKVRELTKNALLTQQTFLAAIKTWLDEKIVTFNNKYLLPAPKGLPTLAKLAKLSPA
jgi:type IV secretory pathway TrbF-like protein